MGIATTSRGITLQAAYTAAQELATTGTQPGNLMYALWIAQVSSNNNLRRNGLAARALAPFVTTRLPERDVLAAILRGCRMFFTGRTLTCLYDVERFAEKGILDAHQASHPDIPATADVAEWQRWRANLWAVLHDSNLMPASGWGYKQISFAALLLWPLQSQLAVIDTHICRRYTLSHSGMAKWKNYQRAEALMAADWTTSGTAERGWPLGLYHWALWEEQRVATSTTRGSQRAPIAPDVCESHAWLSPRLYGADVLDQPYTPAAVPAVLWHA